MFFANTAAIKWLTHRWRSSTEVRGKHDRNQIIEIMCFPGVSHPKGVVANDLSCNTALYGPHSRKRPPRVQPV